jgi:subtilisin family serine protease
MLLVVWLLAGPSAVRAQESGEPDEVTSPSGAGNLEDTLALDGPAPEEGEQSTRVIVKFAASENVAERAEVRHAEGVSKVRDLNLIEAEVVEVKGRPVGEAAKDLAARPDVEYAVPDRLYRPAGYGDEARFAELWGLNNTGQVVDGAAGVADVDINALEASSLVRSTEEIVVAVIDDGTDFTHPDLKDRAWTNPGEIGVDALGNRKETNGEDDDGNGCFDDVHGCDVLSRNGSLNDQGEGHHGTHVAGTIAASSDGGGVVGVAPNVKVMAVRFLGPDGGSLSDAVDAITYAAANGAKISNNSWETQGSPDQPLKDAIEASNMLFVAAAGNGGYDRTGDNNDADPENTTYPASFDSPNVLSVASVDNKGVLPYSSNYGATTVDVVAPGENILSTVPGGGYAYRSGTSMAAPHVTGTAALAASVSPSLLLDPAALKQIIMDTAKPLSATSGRTVTGGMVDAEAAVRKVKPTPPETTIDSGPSGLVTSRSSSFSFSSNRAEAGFRCSMDGAPFSVCSSPKGYTGLADGSHTFRVEAVDPSGSTDPTPAERAFTIDATVPSITGVYPQAGANSVAATANVVVSFSEAMNATTLNATTFKLVRSDTGAAVTATVAYNPTTKQGTLDPSANLGAGASYTAKVKGGATGVKDTAGNALSADKAWSFSVTTLSSPR